ncbi:MAG: hypothetical protein FWE58_05505 [Methanobrevibacter sp.]|nr:hypothetical protein [Methanobrevibacter sp.]
MSDIYTIKIKDSVNSSLELNSAATELFNEINKTPEKDIKIDFENVVFMSRSFTQEYVNQKIKTEKNIIEVNIPEEIMPLLKMIERSFSLS